MGRVETIFTSEGSHRPVHYKYTGFQTTPDPLNGLIDTDVFQFSLTDDSGFESIIVLVTVYVTSAIVVSTDIPGGSSTTSRAIESPTINLIGLYGTDFATPSRPLHVQITM